MSVRVAEKIKYKWHFMELTRWRSADVTERMESSAMAMRRMLDFIF